LNDSVEVRPAPSANYESSWVPADRVEAFMKEEVAFTSLRQRNDAVPATHVTARLPPSLVLIAEAEPFFPPVLRDAAEFVGRALAAGASADLAILSGRKHSTAIQLMVTPTDPAVLRLAEFVAPRLQHERQRHHARSSAILLFGAFVALGLVKPVVLLLAGVDLAAGVDRRVAAAG
jgi:acetyl esterase/lipase